MRHLLLVISMLFIFTGCVSEEESTPDIIEPLAEENVQRLSFHGNDCTSDCSGHEAGYAWAEENDITDELDCSGNSNSFNEGCESYVEEHNSDDDSSSEESTSE